MKRGTRAILIAASALVTCAAAAPAAQADPAVAGEFPLGGQTVGPNNELVAGPDGNIWVTTESTDKIVQMAPDGTAVVHTLAGMTNVIDGITVGPDGKLYGAQGDRFIVIDPANPTAGAQHTVAGLTGGNAITSGPDGHVWIAGTSGLAEIDPANPDGATLHAVALNNPKGMTTGSDGLLWIADFTDVVNTTTSAPTTLKKYTVGGGTQDVAAGPDGQVAFVNPGASPHSVGLITPPADPQVIPLTTSDPDGVTFGTDGAYWVARASADDLLRVTTTGETTPLNGFSISGSVGPRKVAVGPDNTLWVTLDAQEKVAKVTGVDPPVVEPPPPPPPPPPPGTAPETTIVKAPKKKVEAKEKTGKAKVKVKFSATGNAPSFECTLTKKGKKPRTGACTSPKKYKLKPGKYKFAVAATADGLTDATPAKARFKVVEP